MFVQVTSKVNTSFMVCYIAEKSSSIQKTEKQSDFNRHFMEIFT